jgi:TPR repeat protein
LRRSFCFLALILSTWGTGVPADSQAALVSAQDGLSFIWQTPEELRDDLPPYSSELEELTTALEKDPEGPPLTALLRYENKHPGPASVYLARFYRERNLDRSIHFARRARTAKTPGSKVLLATALLQESKKGSLEEATLLLERAAESQDPAALLHLASLHELKLHPSASLKKALNLYEKSAQARPSGYAHHKIAYFHEHGISTAVDAEKAQEHYLKAAALSEPISIYNLAALQHKTGDYEEAFHLALRSAQLGYPEAQYFLGISYLIGEGRTQDPTAAVAWLDHAARSQHPKACLELGHCYEKGNGIQRNFAHAETLYTIAAKGGLPLGHAYLARLLFEQKKADSDAQIHAHASLALQRLASPPKWVEPILRELSSRMNQEDVNESKRIVEGYLGERTAPKK